MDIKPCKSWGVGKEYKLDAKTLESIAHHKKFVEKSLANPVLRPLFEEWYEVFGGVYPGYSVSGLGKKTYTEYLRESIDRERNIANEDPIPKNVRENPMLLALYHEYHANKNKPSGGGSKLAAAVAAAI